MHKYEQYIEKSKNFKRISVDVENSTLYINALDQEWNHLVAQKELRELDIFFANCGVLPIRLIQRESHNPLIQIGGEDDGHAWFDDDCPRFDIYWAIHLISDLKDAIVSANDRNLIYFGKDFIEKLISK